MNGLTIFLTCHLSPGGAVSWGEPTFVASVDSMGASRVAQYSPQEVAARAFAFDARITTIGR